MAVRVTADEVRLIIDLESSMTDEIVDAMIFSANTLINSVCTDASLTDTLLKEIERWVSAHFCAIRDQRLIEEDVGDARDKYQHKEDLGLRVTHYGQQAILLDISGGLAEAADARTIAKFTVYNPEFTQD